MPFHFRKRQALVGLIAGLAVAALALTGCSAEPATATAAKGGTLNFAIDSDPGSNFDIHASAADVTALVLRNVFDSLVAQAPDGSFKPWLAKSWKISSDGTSYTFALKSGVKFQDGEAFDAAAVKANFDHIVNPSTKSQYAAGLLGGPFYKSTVVVDPLTVQVNFTQPFSPFLQGASTTYLGFYAPKVLAASADKLIAGGSGVTVGTGPFSFAGYTAGQSISLKKNKSYDWGPGNAKHTGPALLDAINIQILPENSVRSGALTSGQVDVAGNIAPSDAASISNNPDFTFSGVDAPGLPYSLFLNHSRGVFQDKKVRQAFQQGFDLDAAVKAIYQGQYKRAWSVLGPTTPNSYDKSVEGSWPYDTKKANKLLDEAGWTDRDSDGYRVKDGVRLSASWPSYQQPREDRQSLGDAIQADLKKIGFELVRKPLDGGAYIDGLYSGNYDIADWSFVRSDADVLRLHLFSTFAPVQNASYVNDPKVDKLVTEAAETTDAAKRTDLYGQIQKWVIDDAAIVPLYVPSYLLGTSKKVDGIRTDINGWPLFYDAYRTEGS